MKLPPRPEPMPVVERAGLYLDKLPISVSGQNGHDRLFYAACQMVLGFRLDRQAAFELLRDRYSPRCDPPWDDADLWHKVDDAGDQEGERGYLLGDDHYDPGTNGKPKTEGQPDKPPQLVSGAKVLQETMLSLLDRESEIVFDCGNDLHGFELGPGKITIVGAPPGTGKTSLASQAAFSALENHGELNLVIANAEMDPHSLMKRELAGRAEISYQRLRFATYDDREHQRLIDAHKRLQPLMSRTELFRPPYSLDRLMGELPEVPGLLVVDYLQKFRSRDAEGSEGIEAVMNQLRMIAMDGWAVLALSSTKRQEGKGGGHSAAGLDMASFRGSGEIEFQADAAYVLRDQSEGGGSLRPMLLDCVKNRHGERKDLNLTFQAERMRFVSGAEWASPHVDHDPDRDFYNG